jgi:hypothetical protein
VENTDRSAGHTRSSHCQRIHLKCWHKQELHVNLESRIRARHDQPGQTIGHRQYRMHVHVLVPSPLTPHNIFFVKSLNTFLNKKFLHFSFTLAKRLNDFSLDTREHDHVHGEHFGMTSFQYELILIQLLLASPRWR